MLQLDETALIDSLQVTPLDNSLGYWTASQRHLGGKAS